MVRVTIFFIGGILLGCQYPNLIKDSIGIAGLAFLLLLYVTLRHAALKKARVMMGAVGLLFIFLDFAKCAIGNCLKTYFRLAKGCET